MAKPKKTTEKAEEVVVEAKADTKTTSEAYNSFKAFIDEYAKTNPQKYETKKEELLAKLNALK